MAVSESLSGQGLGSLDQTTRSGWSYHRFDVKLVSFGASIKSALFSFLLISVPSHIVNTYYLSSHTHVHTVSGTARTCDSSTLQLFI